MPVNTHTNTNTNTHGCIHTDTDACTHTPTYKHKSTHTTTHTHPLILNGTQAYIQTDKGGKSHLANLIVFSHKQTQTEWVRERGKGRVRW